MEGVAREAIPLGWKAWVLGLGLSCLAAPLLMDGLVTAMWRLVPAAGQPPNYGDYRWSSWLLGAIERCLYVVALYLQKAELIAGWLVLKTAGRWQSIRPEGQDWTAVWPREKAYDVYVIGNGLSFGFAFASWLLMQQTSLENAILVIAAILIASSLLQLWLTSVRSADSAAEGPGRLRTIALCEMGFGLALLAVMLLLARPVTSLS